jgi:NAD(P)H-hydrate repair Nnr-like enzyme with NAD(P)H-hydrate dehydratase domain
LTPNANEYKRLQKAVGDPGEVVVGDAEWAVGVSVELRRLCAQLGGVTIVAKGAVDQISNGSDANGMTVSGSGSSRRSGGQGDVLAGACHSHTRSFSSCRQGWWEALCGAGLGSASAGFG